jgi:hypothetical protein
MLALGSLTVGGESPAETGSRQSFPSLRHVLALDGKAIDPLHGPGPGTNVFIFASIECPISNRYAPEVRRLWEQYNAHGIRFWIVYPNRGENEEALRQHLKAYNYPCPGLRDTRHELVKASKVRVTPEAAVFTPREGLRYHGRIDNRHQDLGKMRPAATEHDLEQVLAALVAGKEINFATNSTRAVGCLIAD